MKYFADAKKSHRLFGVAPLFALIFVLTGCADTTAPRQKKQEPQILIMAEWNVQALFDGNEAGGEYGEYLESAGWTPEKYTARITALSQAIQKMLHPDNAPEASSKISFPDLIGIVEVENAGVIEDLARFELSKRGYYWTAFTVLSGSSLGIGILSRFPINGVRAHSITVGKDTAPRPVLEVRIEPGGNPIVVLLCHWKSKLGDAAVTESIRRSSARVVSRRVRELSETEPDTPVIVMGDLNENHDEFYRQSGKVFSALLPDDPAAAALAAAANGFPGNREEYLVLSGEKPPAAFSFPDGNYALYSPWQEEMTEGSYWYRDEWETIDHFLLSENLFNGAGWNYDSFRVARYAPFTGSGGVPNTYVPRFGRGLSDHLPLLLYLRYKAED